MIKRPILPDKTFGAMFILVVILVTALICQGSQASHAIVNNSTSSPSGEDSLSMLFFSLDSLGNPTTADSVCLLVSGPDGSLVCRDSMAISDGRISATTVVGKQFYCFKDQVSNLDGSGATGCYSLTILAKKNIGNLLTPNSYSFQVISEELSDQLALIGDSVSVRGGVIDTNLTEQGGGGDSTSLARWVWNTPQSNHTTAGSFGKYLDAEVSSIGSGSGVYAVTIQAYDSTIEQAIPLAGLAIRNLSQTSLIAVGQTDSYGRTGFNLDADSFLVVASASGYVFEAYDTVVVAGAGVDTVFAEQFDPGTPSLPFFCRVYGFIYNASGQPEADVFVSASLPSGVSRYAVTTVVPTAVTTSTDSVGYYYIDLIASSVLDPSDTKYEFTISRQDGAILRKRLSVPDQSSWLLTW